MKPLLNCVTILLLATVYAEADTVIISASADTEAVSSQPDNNFGTSARLRLAPIGDVAGEEPSRGTKRVFIKFGISSVPPGATITNVVFRAFQRDGAVHLGAPQVIAIGDGWEETSLTWNHQPTATKLLGTMRFLPRSIVTFSSPDLIELVRSWHSGKIPANGLMFRAGNEAGTGNGDALASRENTEFPIPELVVEFTPATSLTIRVSQVELCWGTAANTVYQLEYRSQLTTNAWLPLGGKIHGDGLPFCTNDTVVIGQPQKFYRLQTTNAPPQF